MLSEKEITEKTHRVTPFLLALRAQKTGRVTFEKAFHHYKDIGVLKKETTYTEFLDTLAYVSLTRITLSNLVTVGDIESAIVTAQIEQEQIIKEKTNLSKGISNVS